MSDAIAMAPTRRNIPRAEAEELPDPQVVDPRNWNVPLVLMITITAGLVVGAWKVATLWNELDSRLARIEQKQDAAAQIMSDVVTRQAFSNWIDDTKERNDAWKPARAP